MEEQAKGEAFYVRLFGDFQVVINGIPVAFPRRKEAELLATLCVAPRNERTRTRLMEDLWPDGDATGDRYNLRRALTGLRKALGSQVGRLRTQGHEHVALVVEASEVDVLAFDAAIARGDTASKRSAVGLYTGPPVFDLDGVQHEGFGRRTLTYLEAVEELAEEELQSGEDERAIAYLRRCAQLHPHWQPGLRSLMTVLRRTGRYQEVFDCYRELLDWLRLERGGEVPDEKTKELYERIKEEARSVRERYRPRGIKARAGTERIEHYPRANSHLVGREALIRRIASTLLTRRLVTLTGFAGVGKSRLAVEIAADLAPQYGDGVCMVDAAPMSGGEHVAIELMRILTKTKPPLADAEEAVIAALRPRHLLLILDNCERVLGVCAGLAERITRECAHVSVLVTSRERMRLTDEKVIRVPTLKVPLPSDMDLMGGDERIQYVASSPAADLFVARARDVADGFELSAENARQVATVCNWLDGNPFALQMAASHLSTVSLDEIVAGLGDRFELLKTGWRTAREREASLRALIDWSYQLLPMPERTLFNRLWVFGGTWDIEAAREVCTDDKLPVLEVRERLSALVDKSLVMTYDAHGRTRYYLFQTAWHYSRENCSDEEWMALIGRHVGYFQRLKHWFSWETSDEPSAPPEILWELANVETAAALALIVTLYACAHSASRRYTISQDRVKAFELACYRYQHERFALERERGVLLGLRLMEDLLVATMKTGKDLTGVLLNPRPGELEAWENGMVDFGYEDNLDYPLLEARDAVEDTSRRDASRKSNKKSRGR